MESKARSIVDKNGVMRVIGARPNNYYRQVINDENLLEYAGEINMMDRDKLLVKDYAAGSKYTELSEKYGISYKSVPGTISRYVRKAHACKRDKER